MNIRRYNSPYKGRLTTGGLSLIEMLVYVAVLSSVAVLVVTSILQLSSAYSSLIATKRINTAAVSSIERILRETRSSSRVDISSSTLGTHPSVLVLETDLSGGGTRTVSFYLDNGVLKVVEDGTPEGALTQTTVTVSNFVVSHADNSNRSDTIKLDLTVDATNGSATKSSVFHGSAVTRGSY